MTAVVPHKHDGVPVEQGLAALVSAGVLLLAGVLLWQVPGVAIRPDHSPRSELRWVWQPPAAPPQVRAPAMPHTDPQPAVPAPSPAAAVVSPPATERPIPLPSASPSPTVVPDSPSRLRDSQGRVQLPATVTASTVDRRSQAERMFEDKGQDPTLHPDRGLFERDLAAGTPQGRAERWLYGRDIQAARARQAPAVAYNPALHERPADLPAAGSADAYLAAPVGDQPAPGREGQASAALLPQMAAVQGTLGACRPVPSALAALERHMAALQVAERRWVKGSSPEERRHTLPAEIDRQYTLARRALWQLAQAGGRCSG